MSYQPLARKYRPTRFEELAGQDSVAKALAGAIRLGREPHGLIFAGVRGIGKTTTARLYAKSLNCEAGPTPTPCNECPSCVAIAAGSHEDVMEIDGASNTGVADVRALQETVEYVPQRSRYKVYIVDEVHMLSQAAFNALLKTLEEPPRHVIFIFATTELSKVPQTIVSRCQTFYLQKMPLAVIRSRLEEILQTEGISYEEKALALVAREGHGSMRDALTLLDQAIALGEGRVTVESLGAVVTNLSSTPYIELLEAMVDRDAPTAMAVIKRFDESGAEFAVVAEEAAKFARHGFVVKDLGREALDAALLGLDDDELGRLAGLAQRAPRFDLNRIFRTLTKCRTEMDGSTLDRYVFENNVFEWCFDPGLPDVDGLLDGLNESPSSGPSAPSPGARSEPPRSEQGSPSPTRSGAEAGGRMRNIMAEIKSGTASGNAAETPPPPDSGQAVAAPSQPTVPPAPKPPEEPPTQKTPEEPPAQKASDEFVSDPEPSQESPSAVPSTDGTSEPEKAEPATEFPETWRQLVDAWKRKKPLQARKLEEVHCLEFSVDSIVLAIPEDSYASQGLLQREEQRKIATQFRELFGFRGQLSAMPRSQATLPDEPVAEESSAVGAQPGPAVQPAEDGPSEPAVDPMPAPESSGVGAPQANDGFSRAGATAEPVPSPAPQEAADTQVAPQEAADTQVALQEAADTQAASQSSSEADAPAEGAALPDTLLTVKSREAAEYRKKVAEQVRNAPLTQEVLEVFGASIEDITVKDGGAYPESET